MVLPPVYIAAPDGARYHQLLRSHLGGSWQAGLATSATEVTANYGGEPIVLGSPDLLAELLTTAPPVQWAQSTWAGVAPLVNLPFRNYVLTGVKGIFGPQMGEYVIGQVLAHALKLEQRQAAQANRQWDQSPSDRVAGKVMGIMGTGSIGRHVAHRAAQLGLRVVGYSRSGRPAAPFDRVYSGQALKGFLAQCDYLVGILPDLPATTGLIDAAALRAMKSSALLINVGRGNLVDEVALCRALNAGELAGAVLDVCSQEPLPADSPLWHASHCRITGHVAARSRPEDIAPLFLRNYRRWQHRQPLEHRVDFDRGY